MEYTDLETIKYNLHHIKTDKFAINQVLIRYSIPFRKELLTEIGVLSKYIARANKKYKNIKEVTKEIERRFILQLDFIKDVNHSFLNFSLIAKFPDEDNIGINKIENIFEFIFEILNEVDFEESSYTLNQLNLSKDKILKQILKEKENKSSYSNQQFSNIIFKDTPYGYNSNGDEKDLSNINLAALKQIWEELQEKSQIDIFAISNMDLKTLNKIIDSKINKRINKKLNNEFIVAKNYNGKETIEKIEANQSILKMAYIYENVSEYELNAVIPMFTEVFGGGGGSILFQEIREKNSLCYYIGARNIKYSKFILINSGISSSNYDKTKNLVIQELEKMKKGNIDDFLIEGARMTLINNQLSKTDSKSSLLNEYLTKVDYNELLKEEKIKKLKKVTKKDIADFASKLKLSCVYLLEGVEAD